jgi:hypothetical protein
MSSIRMFLAVIFFCFSCTKSSVDSKERPSNYQEMFKALKIETDVQYNYTEVINNRLTGHSGTIILSLKDTSITESYNSNIIKDHFRLDSFQAYTCKLVNFGRNKYKNNECLFINNARKAISFVNGTTMISFDSISNGSYFYYQYLITK